LRKSIAKGERKDKRLPADFRPAGAAGDGMQSMEVWRGLPAAATASFSLSVGFHALFSMRITVLIDSTPFVRCQARFVFFSGFPCF
jgi:hypothetical protein